MQLARGCKSGTLGSRGFSIIELLIVIVIIVILAAAVVWIGSKLRKVVNALSSEATAQRS